MYLAMHDYFQTPFEVCTKADFGINVYSENISILPLLITDYRGTDFGKYFIFYLNKYGKKFVKSVTFEFGNRISHFSNYNVL